MKRMDETAAMLRADEVQPALRFIQVLELSGQMSSSEAEEWRRRIEGWARFRRLPDNERPRA